MLIIKKLADTKTITAFDIQTQCVTFYSVLSSLALKEHLWNMSDMANDNMFKIVLLVL